MKVLIGCYGHDVAGWLAGWMDSWMDASNDVMLWLDG